MSELDEIVKKANKGKKGKKGGDMKGAVEGTEEIRSWVSKTGFATRTYIYFGCALKTFYLGESL